MPMAMEVMSVSNWTTEQVVEWLKGLPISESPAFYMAIENRKLTGAQLLELDHAKLIDLHVAPLGNRDVILSGIQRLATLLSEHHSDYCHTLANDIITHSRHIQRFLCTKYSILMPQESGIQITECPERELPDGEAAGSAEPAGGTHVAVHATKSCDPTVKTVSDLLYKSRHLALWLDRAPAQEYVSDYLEFRDILLKCALFVACKFLDHASHAKSLVEQCITMCSLARSVKHCLASTALGSVRPVRTTATLEAPADGEAAKGWGFSVKCCYGSALVNCILNGTPAAHCPNLKPKDELVAVDGVAVTNWTLENITQRLREVSKRKPLTLDLVRGSVAGDEHEAGNVSVEEENGEGAKRSPITLVPSNLILQDLPLNGTSPLISKRRKDSSSAVATLIDAPQSDRSKSKVTVSTSTGSCTDSVCAARRRRVVSRSVSAQMCDDEGSSPEASGDEFSKDESNDRFHSVASPGRSIPSPISGVKTSASDSLVVSQAGGTASARSTTSMPDTTPNTPPPSSVSAPPANGDMKNLEFGYRTQIVGGVVMRIPVANSNDDSSKSKTPKKSKWSILSAKIRKNKGGATTLMQGCGRADLEAAEPKKQSVSRTASSDLVSRKKSLDSVQNHSTCGRHSSDADASSGKDDAPESKEQLKKKRSSPSVLPQSLSRMLDKETAVGDCLMPAASLTNPECCGWLTKQGNVKKNWKRRWFVLKDLCLYYYRTPKDTTALNVIPLPSYSVEMAPDIRRNFSIRLNHKNTRTFLFYCDTFEDMLKWLEAIRVACEGTVRTAARSSVTSMDMPSQVADLQTESSGL